MADSGLILAFDTSAAHCAAALVSGGRNVAGRHEPMATGQAERLFPLLGELLAEAGADWGDLTALAVGIGPGNFTGVRLSVAAARGIALARAIPAHGITLFEALAFGLSAPTLALVDARQGRIYAQLFTPEPGAPRIATADDLAEMSRPGLSVVGHDRTAVAARLGATAQAPLFPVAEAMARIASVRHAPAHRPAPLYLRPADAAPPRDAPPVILP